MSVMQGPGGDGGDLSDATRQWLRDEAAKTQAWLDGNRPVGTHSHYVVDNHDWAERATDTCDDVATDSA